MSDLDKPFADIHIILELLQQEIENLWLRVKELEAKEK